MDNLSPEMRSRVMARVKSKGNVSTEMRLIDVLRENSVTGWRRGYPLFGKPDFTFPKKKVAVFVDGCFWHGHPQKCRMPNTNRAYWERKISRNKARDRLVTRTLDEMGWHVIRIWEDSINSPNTVNELRKALS